jgi:hypothetical protein
MRSHFDHSLSLPPMSDNSHRLILRTGSHSTGSLRPGETYASEIQYHQPQYQTVYPPPHGHITNNPYHNLPFAPAPSNTHPPSNVPILPSVHVVAPSPAPPTRTTGRRQGRDEAEDTVEQSAPRRSRARKTASANPTITPSPALAPDLSRPQLSVCITPTMVTPATLPDQPSGSTSVHQEIEITRPSEPKPANRGRGNAATDVWHNVIPLSADRSAPEPGEQQTLPQKPVAPYLQCKMCRYDSNKHFSFVNRF